MNENDCFESFCREDKCLRKLEEEWKKHAEGRETSKDWQEKEDVKYTKSPTKWKLETIEVGSP